LSTFAIPTSRSPIIAESRIKSRQAPLVAIAAEEERNHGIQVAAINPLENRQLFEALNAAINAPNKIADEQARLRTLLAEAKTDIEKAAREYQIEYIESYLNRAARLAQKRLDHFATIETQDDVDREIERVRTDKIYWFEMYAWGYDPRARTPLSIVPFELFPTQRKLCNWLDEIVFDKRSSGIIEKARDEGATEQIVRWGIHNWLFREGFSMLLSSRTEDEVDTKKKQGTLFERARFQIRLLPTWMLPAGFNLQKDLLPDKLIAAPNGNTLVGQAPVENMGRGDRVTCAMFDEFAFWRFGGYPQFRSMSQTTDSIIMPSSVGGRLNQYADIAHDDATHKFVMDWRQNPFKDKRWYDALPYGFISPKMSRTSIAQEVDRDYEASQPGKVWKPQEPYIFISRSEFLKPFEKAKVAHYFKDPQGRFKIPDDWRIVRTHDFGKSQGHDWAYLIGAQPRANYPLADTHFIFIARILEPTGLEIDQAVKQWTEWETKLCLRDQNGKWLHAPHASYNSHEQEGLRKVLLNSYGENWIAWDTDYEQGISEIEDWWTPIDLEKPNPFRPELDGRCRLVFVAPDGEYQLARNERLEQYFVTTSTTEEGFKLARKQISSYHYPESELGKAVKKMRPVKEFDDIIDTIRGYAVNWNRQPTALTIDEKMEEAMPEALKLDKVAAAQTDDQKLGILNARRVEFSRIAEQFKKQNRSRNPLAKLRKR
jgi:hypothetical protein